MKNGVKNTRKVLIVITQKDLVKKHIVLEEKEIGVSNEFKVRRVGR